MSVAEYLHQLRTHGDLTYEQKKAWCKTFLDRGLARIRTDLDAESLTYDVIFNNLLLHDGDDTWLEGPLSKAAWDASEFAAEYRAGLPEDLDEADILARFPPPNNGRVTLLFEGDTVEILGSSNFKFPASLCSIQHPEGGRVECDLNDAASLYVGLADRMGALLRDTLRRAVLDASKNMLEVQIASYSPVIFPLELRTKLAENHVCMEASRRMTDAEKDRLRDRFVEVILSSETYATMSPIEKEFIRIQTPFYM